MEDALITAEGLSGGYQPEIEAIKEISFAVEPGRIVGILGPNGGGKTTLFRALLGELTWRHGSVEIANTPAYVPQTSRSRLDLPISAFDVALMGVYSRTPWYRRISKADRAIAREALHQLGLSDNEETLFGALSGGQRQRVLIARALAQRANVLLLDEPFSGVDVTSSAHIEATFEELRKQDKTMLISTHDIQQAQKFDYVLCLNRKQFAFGKPQKVLTQSVLQATYGDELIVLDSGHTAVAIQHHDH